MGILSFDKLNIMNILYLSKAFYFFSSERYYQSLTRYKNFIFVQIWTPFDTESPNLQYGTHFNSLDRLYILLPFIWGVNLSYRSLCSKYIDMNVTLYPCFTFSKTRKNYHIPFVLHLICLLWITTFSKHYHFINWILWIYHVCLKPSISI